MKTIKREILKVGQYGRMGGQKVIITPEIIKDVRETFDGKCPCTIGHELADYMPKFGDVKTIEPESTAESIVATMNVHDVLADAINEKFYEDTSVGIERNLQGKYYLHHNAFLGAIPPKIRDLKVFADLDIVCLAAGPASALTPPAARAQAGQRMMDSKRQAEFGLNEARSAIAKLQAWAAEMALSGSLPSDLAAPIAELSDQLAGKQKAPAAQLADKAASLKPDSDPKEGDTVELKEENEALRKNLADANSRILAGAKGDLAKAMEGRVPKAKQGAILSLADRLVEVKGIKLADGDGKEKTVDALEILKEVFESIPKPVTEGRADLGDTEPQAPKKTATVPFGKA